MVSFNQRSTEQFNAANAEVDQDAISKYFDRHLARLCTHLDLQLIRRRILRISRIGLRSSTSARQRSVTGHLATLASRVVAIEPFDDYYRILATRFSASPNITTRRTTLADYAASTDERFDLIYLGGVLPHSRPAKPSRC